MARFVPERSDDFVFENNLIAGRFYGKARKTLLPGYELPVLGHRGEQPEEGGVHAPLSAVANS